MDTNYGRIFFNSEHTELQLYTPRLLQYSERNTYGDDNVDSLLDKKGYLTGIPGEYVTETALAEKGYLTSVPTDVVRDADIEDVLRDEDLMTLESFNIYFDRFGPRLWCLIHWSHLLDLGSFT